MRSLRGRPRRVRGGLISGVVAVLAGAVLVASLGAGGAGTALGAAPRATHKACTGKPIVIAEESNISTASEQQTPDVPQGAKAAAAAITKTCELGRPVKIAPCDDQFSPNVATTCGNNAVSHKAIADIAFSCCGSNYAPALIAAGIPIMSLTEASALETTSPDSYPIGESLPMQYSAVQLLKASGAKKLAIMALDVPEVTFLTTLIANEATKLGLPSVIIPVTPGAADLTSYAQQVVSDGANAIIPIISSFQVVPLEKDLAELGHSEAQIHTANILFNTSQTSIKDIGQPDVKGLLVVGWSLPPTDTTAPSVKQYLTELAADHQPKPTDSLGFNAWSTVHVIADALKAKHLRPTAADVKKALNTDNSMPKLTVHYGLVPFNFTHNAFPNDPVLSKDRIFTHYAYDFQVNKKNVLVPLFKGVPVNAQTAVPKGKA